MLKKYWNIFFKKDSRFQVHTIAEFSVLKIGKHEQKYTNKQSKDTSFLNFR